MILSNELHFLRHEFFIDLEEVAEVARKSQNREDVACVARVAKQSQGFHGIARVAILLDCLARESRDLFRG